MPAEYHQTDLFWIRHRATDNQLEAMLKKMRDQAAELADARERLWKKADTKSPAHQPGTWSDKMICITNLGNVYKLSYMGGWQRLSSFLPGEVVEWWIENPQESNL